MTSPLDQSLSELNINANEDHKIRLKYIKNQFQQGKSVFKGYQTFCKKYGDGEMTYKDFDFWWYRFKNGQNDLDYDRSKDPETREFSDFPVEVVKKLIEISEWNEKLVLRKVSKELREIVDNSKHSLKEIMFFANDEYVGVWSDCCSWDLSMRVWKEVFTYLGIILNWPKMETECLRIECNGRKHKQLISQLIEIMKKLFSSLNHQISIRKLQLDVLDLRGVHAVLPFLKPGVLEEISINNEDYECNFTDTLIYTDQWKHAKYVDLRNVICPIESLFHFERLDVNVIRMSIDKLVMLKNGLLASPKFESCTVTMFVEPDKATILNALGSEVIPIPETNQLFVIEYKTCYYGVDLSFEKRSA